MKKLRRTQLAGLAVIGASALLAVPALASSSHAVVTIRHQMRGCHSWSVNGGAYRASQSVTIARGGTLKVVDNDVMPHKLVQVSGPKVAILRAAMAHMSAFASVHFTKAGVYTFTTKPGEDYKWAGKMKTTGEDNVLRLKVKVA